MYITDQSSTDYSYCMWLQLSYTMQQSVYKYHVMPFRGSFPALAIQILSGLSAYSVFIAC